MTTFKASYSKGMILSTSLVLILLLGSSITLFMEIIRNNSSSLGQFGMIAVLILILVSMIIPFSLQLRNIEIDNNNIVINKMIGKIVIPKDEIVSVTRKNGMMSDIRVFGSGGYFGYLGIFRDKNKEKYYAYVNNGNNMIMISTKDKRYVVNCDNFDKVIATLKKKK